MILKKGTKNIQDLEKINEKETNDMPRLRLEEIENRYRRINDKYLQFTYLITQYGVNNNAEYKQIHKIARELRLMLRQFI